MSVDLEKLATAVGGVVVSTAPSLDSPALKKLGFTFVRYGHIKQHQYFRMDLAHVKLYVHVVHPPEGSEFGVLYGYAIAHEHDRQSCDDYVYRFVHGLTDIKAIVKNMKNIDKIANP
jgi:hypothetical protein